MQRANCCAHLPWRRVPPGHRRMYVGAESKIESLPPFQAALAHIDPTQLTMQASFSLWRQAGSSVRGFATETAARRGVSPPSLPPLLDLPSPRHHPTDILPSTPLENFSLCPMLAWV